MFNKNILIHSLRMLEMKHSRRKQNTISTKNLWITAQYLENWRQVDIAQNNEKTIQRIKKRGEK